MAQLVRMPQPGSTMEEGTIVRWFFSEGETVKIGDPLLEIETDKVTLEVESEFGGVLRRILTPAGESVPVHTIIAIFGTENEEIEEITNEKALPASDFVPLNAPPISAFPKGEEKPMQTPSPVSGVQSFVQPSTPLMISPRAQRIATEKGVSLTALAGRGTGPEGRIIERDILTYLEAQEKAAAPISTLPTASLPSVVPVQSEAQNPVPRLTPMAAKMADSLGVEVGDLALGLPGSRVRREDIVRHAEEQSASSEPVYPAPTQGEGYTTIPYSGIRKRIAENVTKSAMTVPRVTLTLEVDMTDCVQLREKIAPDFEKGYGVRLSYTEMILKAAAKLLPEFPLLNASLVEEEIRSHREINIGVAVAREAGLVVPVLKDAHKKTLGEISQALKPLIELANTGKLKPEDLGGGTFTLTNLGSFGIDLFDPILVSGQSAILGIGRIAEKPAVHEGNIVPRSLMNLCLSFDHRILDGAPAAHFLQALKSLLETPVRLLV